MERGTLSVSVTGGGVAMPIAGAIVRIFARAYNADGSYDSAEAQRNVKSGRYTQSFVTNAEGKTLQMTVQTPNIEESFSETGAVPFAICDIYVEKTGYFGALFFGVQIFPQRESILPVNLEPFNQALIDNHTVTAEFTGRYAVVYFIPAPIAGDPRGETGDAEAAPGGNGSSEENSDMGTGSDSGSNTTPAPDENMSGGGGNTEGSGTGENENASEGGSAVGTKANPMRGGIDQLPPRFRPHVAEEVYVPENITVHLGRPSENAENVTVPFQDYIKNVASSEIYPTWPENAIRANIYAQISIALNRVYTEWYASQGYTFQITNSTAFDQAFVNGRNIYGNIERIVDEIFNVYIRREGYEEPLFATYCDGRTTSCNGMTQWGSFELASAGYTPIEILRSFYGDDIELVATDNIMGIESTYGGVPLSIGQMNSDIAVIQRQLNRISNDYPAIPLIVHTNGVFGTDTDTAVRVFQEIFNLRVDGVVGKATWYRISLVYVSVKRLSELTSEGQSAGVDRPPRTVLLQVGSHGEDVTTLQYLLEYISIFYRTVRPVGIDGIFGQETYISLTSFQTTFGLEVTGTTTPVTWDALYGVYESILEVVLPLGEGQYFPGTLQQGDSGDSVRLLQSYLNEIARYYGALPQLEEDGVFGAQTRNSISEFQRLYLLDDTGIVNSVTWYRIVELYNYIQRQGN